MNDPMFVFCFVIVKIIMPEIKEMYKINKRCESNEFMAFYKEKFNCSLGNYKLNGMRISYIHNNGHINHL